VPENVDVTTVENHYFGEKVMIKTWQEAQMLETTVPPLNSILWIKQSLQKAISQIFGLHTILELKSHNFLLTQEPTSTTILELWQTSHLHFTSSIYDIHTSEFNLSYSSGAYLPDILYTKSDTKIEYLVLLPNTDALHQINTGSSFVLIGKCSTMFLERPSGVNVNSFDNIGNDFCVSLHIPSGYSVTTAASKHGTLKISMTLPDTQ